MQGGQFCDRGAVYRTAIFAAGSQTDAANKARANAQADLGKPIVTPVLPAAAFYPADAYHQDYYKQSDLILTRFGPKSKANAYKAYRDARVREPCGAAAPFAGS